MDNVSIIKKEIESVGIKPDKFANYLYCNISGDTIREMVLVSKRSKSDDKKYSLCFNLISRKLEELWQ